MQTINRTLALSYSAFLMIFKVIHHCKSSHMFSYICGCNIMMQKGAGAVLASPLGGRGCLAPYNLGIKLMLQSVHVYVCLSQACS